MELRRAAKVLLAAGLHRCGARRLIARRRRRAAGGRRVLVLGYHRVCVDHAQASLGVAENALITRDTLARHLAFLIDRFEVATMSRAVEVLAGRARAERDLAVVTFDDGYADVLENALPVLQEAGVPATVYVASGVVERAGYFPHDRLRALLEAWEACAGAAARTPAEALAAITEARACAPGGPKAWTRHFFRTRGSIALERLLDELAVAVGDRCGPPPCARALDWDGVRALAASGLEIGSHTVHHRILPGLPHAVIERELAQSRSAIEENVGLPVRHFAYCNGYYSAGVLRALKRLGYASAVTTEDRLNRIGACPYRIGRRVLWENSARGLGGRTSPSLLACQLDDTWAALGLGKSEPGERPDLEAEPSPARFLPVAREPQ